MQDVDHTRKAHRVDRAVRITAMILNDFEDTGAFPLPGFGARVLGAQLRQPERVAHLRLNLGGKVQIVLSSRTRPNAELSHAPCRETIRSRSNIPSLE